MANMGLSRVWMWSSTPAGRQWDGLRNPQQLAWHSLTKKFSDGRSCQFAKNCLLCDLGSAKLLCGLFEQYLSVGSAGTSALGGISCHRWTSGICAWPRRSAVGVLGVRYLSYSLWNVDLCRAFCFWRRQSNGNCSALDMFSPLFV